MHLDHNELRYFTKQSVLGSRWKIDKGTIKMYFDRCVGKSNVLWLRGLICLTASICVNSAHAADTDIRTGSVSCVLDKSGQNVECDYRYPATLDVKEVSLAVADKAVQIPPKGLSNYPASGQSTAILIMVDVSDSRRKNTVEKKNVPAILEMLTSQQSHHKVGIGVFDSDLRILSPISVDLETTRNSVKDIKAGGQSTEFYKSILAGIDQLQRTEATRKGLIILSDGKDEDRAYKHVDVINAAKAAGVVILGLGYLERPTDSPYLQNLKRLAEVAGIKAAKPGQDLMLLPSTRVKLSEFFAVLTRKQIEALATERDLPLLTMS